MRRLFKGFLGFTIIDPSVGDQITLAVQPCFGRTLLKPSPWIHHHGQTVVLHVDQCCRVFSRSTRIGQDHRKRLTHIADLLLGQPKGIHIEVDHGRLNRLWDAFFFDHRAQIFVLINPKYPRQGLRIVLVNGEDFCMCHSTSDKAGMQHPTQFNVVHKTTLPLQEQIVLYPSYGTCISHRVMASWGSNAQLLSHPIG